MTFNIRLGSGSEKPLKPAKDIATSWRKLGLIAEAIGSVNPDVAVLQEVRSREQAQFIARRLGLSYAYVSHPTGYTFFQWGIALLCRFKMLQADTHPVYFDEDLRAGKLGMRALLDIGEGKKMTVVNVHYHHQDFRRQIERTLEMLEEAQGPVALAGDLNLTPENPHLRPLLEKLKDTCAAASSHGAAEALRLGTFPRESSRIDYIFVQPDAFQVVDAGLVPEEHREASDHIAYWADVRFVPT